MLDTIDVMLALNRIHTKLLTEAPKVEVIKTQKRINPTFDSSEMDYPTFAIGGNLREIGSTLENIYSIKEYSHVDLSVINITGEPLPIELLYVDNPIDKGFPEWEAARV